MKRVFSLLLAVCLLMLLSVPAAADGPRPGAVRELYSAEGVYKDSLGNTEVYAFHVPLINADTREAQEINDEIREKFGEIVEQQLSNMEGGYSLWSWHVQWHAYWHGSQLFLLITADEEGGFTDYAAFGYDFDGGKRIGNRDILRELGISEKEYLENLREKVQLMFEDMYRNIPKKDRQKMGYDQMLKKTLAWADMDCPMFLDGTGGVETIVKIASMAGADWYYHLATPFSYG